MKHNVEIAFQKEGGPYQILLEYSDDNGVEWNGISLYEKGVLLEQENQHAEDEFSYSNFIGDVGNRLKENYPEFFDEEKFLTSDLGYVREIPAKYLLEQVDRYVEDTHELYKDGSFSKENRDLMLKNAEKYKELLTDAAKNEQTLFLSCDVSNTHEVFDIHGRELMSSLEDLQTVQKMSVTRELDYTEIIGETPASIEAELREAVGKNMQNAPQEVSEPVHQAANELYGEMKMLDEAEQEHGPSRAWEEFKDNKEEIKKDLNALGQSLSQAKALAGKLLSETIEEARQKVVGAFNKGKEFVINRREQICQRTPEEALNAQMDFMLKKMEQYVQNAPPEMKIKIIEAQSMGTEFMKKMKEIHGIANHPLAAQNEPEKNRILQIKDEVAQKAREVKRSVMDFPTAVSNAIKDKSLDLLGKACNKAISVFDKAMQFLDDQRQKLVDLAPPLKLDRQADPKKIYLNYAQNAVLYNPQLSGKTLDVSVAVALHNSGYNQRVIKECLACSPMLKDLSLKEKSVQIQQMMKEMNKSKDLVCAR